MTYHSLEEMILATAEAVRPPERISVSEAARYHIVKNPGQHEGPFSLDKAPYLREPMDELDNIDYQGMIFAGPARTGKSAMGINWLCHTAITDPTDMLFVAMAQHVARDWSQADLAKALRNSPELQKRLVPGRQNDNVFDKTFLSGMRVVVTWPTIKNLSGKTIPRQFIMDLDRIKPQLIDNEATVFDATRKRGGTFKRYAMCAAEASPGFPVTDPRWAPSSPHEAPPCEGILGLYNRGDRRRWYWRCPQCEESFEPHFKLLDYPEIDSTDLMERAEQVKMICPHDGYPIDPQMQYELNLGGRWLKEGQTWLQSGEVVGKPRRSDIASFWMFGPAAGFTNWPTLVHRYLQAQEDYEKTGNEATLMGTVNLDQGDAYIPKAMLSGRLPETLKGRAEDWGGGLDYDDRIPLVPVEAGGGFLMATIDVQARSFVVHVYHVAMGGDIWHIDMFKIRKSERMDRDGHPHVLDPKGFGEDWDTIVPQVIERAYPLNDGSGRQMAIKMTVCDTGGEEGVTSNAYDFYRRLRADNKHGRFHLLAGRPSKTDMVMLRPTMFDSQKKDRYSVARGDIPGWLVNSNFVKDAASNYLDRDAPGGQVHFPKWAPDWLYSQLTNEIRTAKGWEKIGARRNEAWDLLCYCIAFLSHPDIRLQFIDWSKPPSWAGPWDQNEFVFGAGGAPAFAATPPNRKKLTDLGDTLG